MQRLSIEAFEDRSHPGGGRAVVLLRGLDRLPAPGLFRLNIIDASPLPGGIARLSAGDLEPTHIRQTPDGIELVMGPEITACPQLLPGTAVEIEVPAVAIRGGFLWPAIAPATRPPSRFNILRRANGTADAPYPAPTSSIVLPAARDGGREVAPEPRHGSAKPSTGRHGGLANGGGYGPHYGTEFGPGGGLTGHAWTSTNGHAAKNGALAPEDARRDTGAAIRWQPAPGPAHEIWTSSFGATTVRLAWWQRFAGSRLGRGAAFLATVAVSVLVIELALAALPGKPWLGGLNERAGTTAAEVPVDLAGLMVLDWLRAGGMSPKGVAVAGVTPEEALTRANTQLIAGRGRRDTDEGIFWLQHYLSASAGEATLTRALTQLGSAYAERSRGKPDLERARHLWQTAAALGDPLAMCFLGRLFSQGLGVAVDATVGANWMERARRAGGCGEAPGHGGAHER